MSLPSIWQWIPSFFENRLNTDRQSLEKRFGADSVKFSISFIALAAKIAKADGTVTRDEVVMFRRIFDIPPNEEANVARFYDLCRQTTVGFEAYARQISSALPQVAAGDALRKDVLDGLFLIATADGTYHPQEDIFLRRVAEILGVTESLFLHLRTRHDPAKQDPWSIMGIDSSASMDELKTARNRFLRENHPDRLIGQGMPKQLIEVATVRIADFNTAYGEVMKTKSFYR